ncbi:uncharacterized protein LACBIDRAFT_305635 [Laccaria bicolor S238N-H82]|uniref:Predicted protein n=1 Tax=Laccaria bicolor (strain S238N-H82 / ATCC MYA-4686) TaxID=486041 RepID=B0CUP6_LACBS|nr:uncharacterized protein LACBIDRAFT_305635 [Laccaria bicolor S238N-H82]EDR14707.1 predicted protein [Laccaria bicolor S238N-H82]|eukprot:XP_001875266.1 predicted protein [Laccaria bicolor S238N-H82]
MDRKRLELVKPGRIDHLERRWLLLLIGAIADHGLNFSSRWRFSSVGLTQETYRRRALTVSNTPEGRPANEYRERTRDRDRKCLITGLESYTWTQSRAAHNTHLSGWLHKRFYEHINDPGGTPSLQAQVDQLGRPTNKSKIDSIQNVFLLRADLHESWDDFKFGINPDAPIISRIRTYDHLIFYVCKNHFFQCVLKNMKGAGEPTSDYEDALGDGGFDSSRQDFWGDAQGRKARGRASQPTFWTPK